MNINSRPSHSIPQKNSKTSGRHSVAFRTIGCKLNQCETAQMQQLLAAEGYRLVDWEQPASIRVINTCTVTAKSDRTCRHQIRLAKRMDPGCILAVTGCLAQVDPATVAAIPGVDLVLGNLDKPRLAEFLRRCLEGGSKTPASPSGTAGGSQPKAMVMVSPYPENPGFETEVLTTFPGYTRAFLKIQTGCDSSCTYCIVPRARGPARSMPSEQVLAQIHSLAASGYREVVLTGIDLGSWGHDTGEGSLADLLRLLVARSRVDRFRLSSVEPLEMDEALLDAIETAGGRVARHFHLPLQSGSDPVLKRMARPYSAGRYLEIVQAVAARFPDAAIGTDVIVGFPGETKEEFEETLAFVAEAPLTYLHVFSYSDRPGTPAAAMKPKVPPEIIQERSARLRALGQQKKASFRLRLVGSEQQTLVLSERTPDGRLLGLTGNYIEVLLTLPDDCVNRFARVRLDKVLPDGRCEGEVVELEPAVALRGLSVPGSSTGGGSHS